MAVDTLGTCSHRIAAVRTGAPVMVMFFMSYITMLQFDFRAFTGRKLSKYKLSDVLLNVVIIVFVS